MSESHPFLLSPTHPFIRSLSNSTDTNRLLVLLGIENTRRDLKHQHPQWCELAFTEQTEGHWEILNMMCGE